MSIRIVLAALLASLVGGCSEGHNTPLPECQPACADGEVCTFGACEAVVTIDAGNRCAQDSECTGASAKRCDRTSAQCVECLASTDCRSGVCSQSSCAAYPDNCSVALELDLSNGAQSVTSSTETAVDDTQPSCTLGFGAPELVYRVKVPGAGRVKATVTARNPAAFQPVVVIAKTCGSPTRTDELACGFTDTSNAAAEISAEVSAGHYFVWVDGDSGSSGEFTLSVSFTESVAGDYCQKPTVVSAGQLNTQPIPGSTAGFSDDTFGTCGGTAAEVVYALEITAAVRVVIEALPTTSGFEPVLYVRRSDQCATVGGSAQLGCARMGATQAVLDLPRLEPGRYFVFVDGDASSRKPTGSFNLKITTSTALVAPPNDSCATAEVISQPSSGLGTVTVSGDSTTALSDASSGACGGQGPDVVYTLRLSQPRKVTARLTPANMNWSPVLYLRNSCGDGSGSALLACNRSTQGGAATSISLDNLPAGDTSLWVDSAVNAGGAFTLSLDFADPVPAPANDTCASPQVLSGGGGAFTVSGTTAGAADDAATCTFPDGAFSADVVYRVDVTAPSSLTLDVSAASGSSLKPVISLRKPSGCASNADVDEVMCAWPDPADPQRVTRIVGELQPGNYFLWVDGDETTHGAFTLKANLAAPAPATPNDTCNTALPLTPNIALLADTRSAANDGYGLCGNGGPESTGVYAGDVVFTFDNATTTSRTITVVPDQTDGKLFRPVVYVRGPGAPLCGSLAASSQVACAVGATLGATTTLYLPNLPAGTFSVWVDGVAQQSGRFTIKLQ